MFVSRDYHLSGLFHGQLHRRGARLGCVETGFVELTMVRHDPSEDCPAFCPERQRIPESHERPNNDRTFHHNKILPAYFLHRTNIAFCPARTDAARLRG